MICTFSKEELIKNKTYIFFCTFIVVICFISIFTSEAPKATNSSTYSYKQTTDNIVVEPAELILKRPVEAAKITSNYHYRCYYLNGKKNCGFHYGLDIATSGFKVPIYAIGEGKVVKVVSGRNSWRCGGQVVFISHTIKGQEYTSIYMHLRKIFVKTGDLVNTDTVIAYMGGSPSIEKNDKCSTGQHLHLAISKSNYTTWRSNLINPRDLLDFPALSSSYTGRDI